MPRSPVAAALALLLALAPAALVPDAAEAQGQASFTINVVSARSLGCSPDRVTDPDLRVRVRFQDVDAFLTPEASDRAAPVFGLRADFTRTLPTQLSVQVEEAEPGGFLLTGTSMIPCDVAPGEGTWHNMTYHGGAAERIVARGDGPNAAEVVFVVGPGAPASPVAGVTSVTASSAVLSWSRPPDGFDTVRQAVARGEVGADLALLPADATTATLAGLCDNQAYVVRVLRDTPPWTLASADVSFTTTNAPPQPPRVLRADASGGNLSVAWESPTLHDVGRYEVHVGASASFTPTADTRRGTAAASPLDAQGALDVPHRAGDTHVRVRSVDTSGLSATSEAFPIGAPAEPATWPPLSDACTEIRVEAPGAVAAPSPAPPSPAPSPTPTSPAGATPTPATVAPTAPAAPTAATPTAPAAGEGEVSAAGTEAGAGLLSGGGLLVVFGVGLAGVLAGATLVMLLRRR